MCETKMKSSKPGTGVFLPASCVLQAGIAGGDSAAEPSMPSSSRGSNASNRAKILSSPSRSGSPAGDGGSAQIAAAAAACSSYPSSTGSWFNGMTFSPQLPPIAAATGGRHSLDALVEHRAAAAGRYACAGTLLDVLAVSVSAAPKEREAGHHTALECGSGAGLVGIAPIPPIPRSGPRSTAPYYDSGSRLLSNGQAASGAAAGELAQQMFQMQLADASVSCTPGLRASSQRCQQQATSFDGGLAMMQQQQLQYQRQQHQEQLHYSCSLPLGEQDQYRMFGSDGCMSSLSSPLQPVVETAQVTALQQEQLALEGIERELMQLMQAQQQHETGNTSLYGACSGTPSTCFAPSLQSSASAEWPAALPTQAAAMHFPAALGGACPSPQSTALETYIAMHQQQQLGHQLCMQSVMTTRKQHGRLTANAEVKLAQLLAVQQMQMQLQEELLLSLLPGN